MGRLDELEAFVKVVEVESFSEAARQLGISKSYVSKQVSRLEDRLGARMLNRTTRQLTLTDVGAVFYERCVAILDELEEAELAVNDLQSRPRGTLRMSVPMSFGVQYLSKMVSGFMAEHPDLDVELSLSDRVVNIVDEGFDMAIRIGTLKDSSLIARRLTPVGSRVVGSPAYFEEHGTPKHPRDLKNHECLRYAYFSTGTIWHFNRDGEEVSVKVDGRMTANNGHALLEAARQGVGLVLLPDFFLPEALANNELVHVLGEWDCDTGAIWALYPHNRHLSAKVRLFVDYLVDQFETPPW